MTEEVVENTEVEEVENLENKTEEPTEVELKAAEMGWRKDFDGDPDDFIDAKEFIRRKPLFDKIESQKNELREVKKAVELLQSHHERVKASEYQRALADLKAEKKQALADGDADRLIEIDDQMTSIKADERVALAAAKTPKVDPRFVEWVASNQWYNKDSELRSAADEVGVAHSKANPSKRPEEVLEYVVKRIKTLYPEKFRNVNKDKPSAVEGSTSTPSRKIDNEIELSEAERKAMNTFIRSGALTKEQYLADIKRMRGQE